MKTSSNQYPHIIYVYCRSQANKLKCFLPPGSDIGQTHQRPHSEVQENVHLRFAIKGDLLICRTTWWNIEHDFSVRLSSDRGNCYRPYRNLGGPWRRVAIYITTAMRFFASFFKYFPATVGCSDCVYDEIFIVPTKLISNPVSKFLLEKKITKSQTLRF